MITFLNPYYAILFLLIPAIYFYYKKMIEEKKAAAIKFSSLGLLSHTKQKWNWRKHIQFILLMTLIVFIILTLMDPHLPLKQSKKGVNVALAIDVSGSMQAQDYPPNRLEAAKLSGVTLIESLEPNDQVGIILFDTGASTSSFLTPFKDKAIKKLEGVRLRDGKTAIGDGLALAVDMVSSIPNKKKIVILLSDGVSNSGAITPREAIDYAKVNDVQVYTIGMGSSKPVILGYDFFGNPQYAELDEKTLKLIASETDGQYFKSVDANTLDEIYKTISGNIKREREPTSIRPQLLFLMLIIIGKIMYFNYGKKRILQ